MKEPVVCFSLELLEWGSATSLPPFLGCLFSHFLLNLKGPVCTKGLSASYRQGLDTALQPPGEAWKGGKRREHMVSEVGGGREVN